jgi:hypothetical protein
MMVSPSGPNALEFLADFIAALTSLVENRSSRLERNLSLLMPRTSFRVVLDDEWGFGVVNCLLNSFEIRFGLVNSFGPNEMAH